MNKDIKYSLIGLWYFSDNDIIKLLKNFKFDPTDDPIINILNAIILSFNNNMLISDDIKYVESNQFDKLSSLFSSIKVVANLILAPARNEA